MSTEMSKKLETKKQKESLHDHSKYYANPDKIVQEVVTVSPVKKKVIRIKTYGNGVVKRDLVGVIKNNKILYDKGIDKESLGLK